MEYFKDPKNQIYADISFRLGKIITQYEEMSIDEEKFEATLYIAVLQNLMTNTSEHVRQMTKGKRRNSIFNKDISEGNWGIDENCWIKNTFEEKHTLQNFITRLRNSVSHPTNIDLKSNFPSTGYTTLKDDSGIIKKYRFINSSDVNRNMPKKLTLEQVKRIYKNNEFPENISYRQIKNLSDKKYELVLDDKPFIRVSMIDLTVKQLGLFVKELANYLAQPIQEDWDGITITNLIAA